MGYFATVRGPKQDKKLAALRAQKAEETLVYGLGMDALVSVCSGNTNEIMVWAWMLWSAYALGTRTRLWFGHGCSGQRMLWEHERDYGLGMDALVSVCSGNTNEIMVWAWMLWSAYALGTRTRLWFGHGCSGQRMLWEHERDYGLGMGALAIVCSGNTNEIMVWAWMLWSAYALGTRTRLWFGHGCSGQRMLLEQERDYGLGMRLWFGHGCSGQRMLLEQERDYGLGMRLWFGHGCSGQRMLWEQERDYVHKDRMCVLSGVTRGRVTKNKPSSDHQVSI